MEDREVEVVDDSRYWGDIAEFVVEHPQSVGCARPVYVRATVGYTRRAIEVIGEDSWWGSFMTWLYRLMPILFGGKVVMCSSCHNMVFVSSFQERVWSFFRSIQVEDNAKMLVFSEDVKYIPEEKVTKMKADA
jgi:hypothetical protein